MGNNEIRERLAEFGPSTVPDAELVSLVIAGNCGFDLANQVMSVVGATNSLPSRRIGELAAIPGMTAVRAARLVAAVELGRRAALPRKHLQILTTAADVAQHCSHLSTDPDETFYAIAVNSRNRVTGEWVIARGWESGVNLTPRQVFTLLVKENVARVIFVHNHPSGDPASSGEDIRFTSALLEAARTLGVRVLDHVIVAADGFVSLRESNGSSLDFG